MRLTYVAGASPDKWLRVWRKRHPKTPLSAERVDEAAQWAALDAGEAELAIVRLPDGSEVATQARSRGFAIELYRERSVAVLPRDHAYADAEQLALDDIAEFERTPEQPSIADTLALTAAGVGVCVLPLSLARLFHRKDLAVVSLSDGAEWPVFLAWATDGPLPQDFVGITRGRGARSSR